MRENIIKLADSLGLKARNVTSASNGYPTPEIGVFVRGFDTFKELEDFIKDNGGEPETAHWRDGWQNCELKGCAYEPFKPNSEDYGDAYMVVDTIKDLYYEAYSLLESIKVDNLDLAKFDLTQIHEYLTEIDEALQHAEDLVNQCKDVDFENDSIILCDGEFYEEVPKISMHQSHDTHNYSIGAFFRY